jgi:ribosomal protein S18 acetylase RimI-like enzyme
MQIIIRPYRQADYLHLIKAIEDFQDYLIAIDQLHRLRRGPKYGRSYTKRFINSIKNKDGKMFVAFKEKQLIGFIGGIIENQTKEDLLGCIPSKDGRILELFVSPAFRAKGIGKMLMSKMENYFNKKLCTTIRLELLASNNPVHDFYKSMNYTDRTINMIKILKDQ